jgi:hypothetical protein
MSSLLRSEYSQILAAKFFRYQRFFSDTSVHEDLVQVRYSATKQWLGEELQEGGRHWLECAQKNRGAAGAPILHLRPLVQLHLVRVALKFLWV